MKKIIIIFEFLLLPSLIFSLSVSDLSLIYEPTGEYVSFYDDPNRFYEVIHSKKRKENLHWVFNDYAEDINEKYSLFLHSGNIKNKEFFCNFWSIKIFGNFKTTRGVGIGFTMADVKSKYPEGYLLYENNTLEERRNTLYNSVNYFDGVPIHQFSKKNKEFNCIMVFDYMNNNARASEINITDAIMYGLIFFFDKENKVEEIEITFIVTKA